LVEPPDGDLDLTASEGGCKLMLACCSIYTVVCEREKAVNRSQKTEENVVLRTIVNLAFFRNQLVDPGPPAHVGGELS